MHLDWLVYVSDHYEKSRRITSDKNLDQYKLDLIRKKFNERIGFAVEHELIGQEVGLYMILKFVDLSRTKVSDMRALVNAVRYANKLYQRGEILRNLNTEENK